MIEGVEPLSLADHFLDTQYRDEKKRLLLRYHRDDFYTFAGSCYQPMSSVETDVAIYRHLETCWTVQRDRSGEAQRDNLGNRVLKRIVPKLHLVREVKAALPSRDILVADRRDAPCWLSEGDDLDPTRLVSCRNGLLDLSTRTLHPSTPELFSTHALPFDYDPQADDPVAWERFLEELWGNDIQAYRALQQWFGYCVCGDTRKHKIMLIVGPPRSGKGTIGRILTALLGSVNVAGPSLSSLALNFGLQPLLGKPLAIISDARLSGRADQAAVIERLLSISGEDLVPVDRKHKPPLSVKMPTRLMLLTNELPRLLDPSGATASRFIVLTLTESWLGREDDELTDKLLVELPGLLNWSLDGWDQLQESGRFTTPSSSDDMLRELQDLGSPVKAFVRDCCEVGPGCEVSFDDLYQAWKGSRRVQGSQQCPATAPSVHRLFGLDDVCP